MSKPTLLKIVENLLSAGSGDTVNSIFDTVESEQVARIVGDCFKVLKVRLEIPEVYSLFSLESSTDPTKPILMKRPQLAQTVDRLEYDCRREITDEPLMNDIRFVTLEEFLDFSKEIVFPQDNASRCYLSIGNASVEIRYRTDQAPSYFTSYNTEDILLNSIDLNVDATLQQSKTLAYGKLSQSFVLSNDWVPPFDEAGITLLEQEAKTQYWAELKQTENNLSSKKARFLMPKVTQHHWNNIYPTPYHYGRRGKKS